MLNNLQLYQEGSNSLYMYMHTYQIKGVSDKWLDKGITMLHVGVKCW